MLNVHYSRFGDLERADYLVTQPSVPLESYRDGFGNWCTRMVAPAGDFTLSTDGIFRDCGLPDPVAPDATQAAVQDLPFETLVYLLGSRYCDTDLLSEEAWRRFETTQPGWARVQAICDFVHSAVAFDYMEASATRTASETLAGGKGVCRDFAHLAIALCRCMNIPARYCTGYLSEFGEPEPHAPGRLRGLDGGLARRPLVGFRSAQQLKTHGTDPDRPRPGRRRCAADPDFRAEYPDAVRRLDLGRKT
jgi:transglutaminase-like putative cysteine protease